MLNKKTPLFSKRSLQKSHLCQSRLFLEKCSFMGENISAKTNKKINKLKIDGESTVSLHLFRRR